MPRSVSDANRSVITNSPWTGFRHGLQGTRPAVAADLGISPEAEPSPPGSQMHTSDRSAHGKAELEQLTMNARSTPEQIFNAHPPDQRPQSYRDLRPASQVSRFPTPITAKPARCQRTRVSGRKVVMALRIELLVREILSRNLRDRRALARYAGLTGSPDESGLKSREKRLAKAGSAHVVPAHCRTATLAEWMTCASMPRAMSQRASQKPSRPAS